MSVSSTSKFQIILYGIGLAILLIIVRLLEIRFTIFKQSFEIYAGIIATLFTFLGIWLALKLGKPRVQIQTIDKEVIIDNTNIKSDNQTIENLGLSKREIEVLQLMANGFSNQEIAEKLFVSLNTIKTHVKRIFEKLDVKRRTQAINVAKKLYLIC